MMARPSSPVSADNTAAATVGCRHRVEDDLAGSWSIRVAVRSVAFSPDGTSILTGSKDGQVRLWDCEARQPLGRLLEHEALFRAGALGPDGKTFFAVGVDGTLRLWDTASGRLIGASAKQQSIVTSLGLGPDGKTIATGSADGWVGVWDSATGTPRGQPMKHLRAVTSVAISPDGRLVLTGSLDYTARLWDAANGRPIGPPIPHSNQVHGVAFSPDGKTVLTGSWDNTARLWDVATRRPVGKPLVHPSFVHSVVAFGPDGKSFVTGCADKTMRLWNTATGQPVGLPMPQSEAVLSVAFSPDGKSVLAGCNDHTARVWDAETGQPLGPPLPHPRTTSGGTLRVAFSPDGRFVLTSDLGSVRRWDVPTPLPNDGGKMADRLGRSRHRPWKLDERGTVRVLDGQALPWLPRVACGWSSSAGPPPDDPVPRLDAILFGGYPTAARRRLEKAAGSGDHAEAAYAEAIRARPFNRFVRDRLACLYALRGDTGRATAAPRLPRQSGGCPTIAWLPSGLAVVQLWSGDRAGWRTSAPGCPIASAGRPTRGRPPVSPSGPCALGPGASDDLATPVRLAEMSVARATDINSIPSYLTTLGAVLFRAGRFEEAIRPAGNKGSAPVAAKPQPQDWAFQARPTTGPGHRDRGAPCGHQSGCGPYL